MYDLCIRGGEIVTESGTYHGDVYVKDGVVAAIALAGGQSEASELEARETFDVTGCHVLPGVIDAHTHFRTWTEHCDSFLDVIEGAAVGGVSTLLGFIAGIGSSAGNLRDRVDAFLAEASTSGAPIDYGFHMILADEAIDPIPQIESLMDRGLRSAKMFMTYADRGLMVSDQFMFRAMRELRRCGGLAMVHAELDGVIAELESEFSEDPGLSAANFDTSRPAWSEAEGARRAAELALRTGCPLYVVHVTCEMALDVLLSARSRGAEIFIETCPKYMNLDSSATADLGSLAKVAPPLRSVSDRQAITDAVTAGLIDVVASDHSPKSKSRGDRTDCGFAKAPVGAPGTQTLLPMAWRAIEASGGTLPILSRVLCSNPARIFGIADRKGAIEVGRDADMTIIDTKVSSHIREREQRGQTNYSLYADVEVPMTIVISISRGVVVSKAGELLATQAGEFLKMKGERPRAKSSE